MEKLKDLENWRENRSEDSLQQEMWLFYSKWDYEKWDALRNYIKEKFHPAEIEDRSTKFEEKYNNMNNKIDEITKQYEEQRKNMTEGSDEYNKNVQEEREKINEEMRKFFREDMQSYVSGTKSDINTLKQNKDSQINDLKAQLHWIVVEWPKFKEYLSLKRRRLVSINKKIEDLKNDGANYPKNVLVYLMSLTDTIFTWWKQFVKRQRTKMTWRRKSENIKQYLDVINDKLKINSDDSLWTRWLKEQLLQHLNDAKKAYVEKQKQSVGL